jgi:hypothetical protein
MSGFTPKRIELPRSCGPSPQWYVPAWQPGYYLHRDGVVRQNIFHNGEQLGYYETEAEALEVIAKFQKANQETTK